MSESMRQRLSNAYFHMLERLKSTLDESGDKATPAIERALSAAREAATELGELSRDEADRVSRYLQRDIEDAALFLNETGSELKDWLRFDLQLVEDHLRKIFSDSVDQARLALPRLAAQADAVGEWRSGEITGIGTLQCKGCGETLRFQRVGHIPPCPKCHGSSFRRLSRNVNGD